MVRKSPLLLLLFTILSVSLGSCGNTRESKEKRQAIRQDFNLPSSNTLGVLQYSKDATPGYVLFSIHEDTFLIDYCGRVINHWKSNHELGGFYELLEDGSLLRSGKVENDSIDYPGIGGIIERFDWEGNLVWEYLFTSPRHSQHHGMRQLPNGNILLNAVYRKTREEAIAAGRDPERIADAELYDEQIIEIKPSGKKGGTVVWKWSAWDHLIQDMDPQKENYGNISSNPHRIDINFLGISNGAKDWLHLNSIAYNEQLDQIITGSQKLSEIYIIDHSTSTKEAAGSKGGNSNMGGDILYRWGNPASSGIGDSLNRKLFGPHFAHWHDSGPDQGDQILIYNNGLGRKPAYSSIDLIKPVMKDAYTYRYSDTAGFGPTAPDWSYIATGDSTAFYSKIMSSAQRLSNNHTFICEGTKGRLFEIDENGEIVWEYINPETTNGTILKQGESPSSHVFMALHYDSQYAAFKDKKLIPQIPIEINFNIGNCR